MVSEPVSSLRGVGKDSTLKLARLGIRTKLDLILHLPFRYQDRTHIAKLADVTAGSDYYVQGEVIDTTEYTEGRHPSAYIKIKDESGGTLNMRLLHYHGRQMASLQPGWFVRLYGNVRLGGRGLEMVHPEYVTFESDPGPPEPELVPIYHTTRGLTSNRLRGLIKRTLGEASFLSKYEIHGTSLSDAIRKLHLPEPQAGLATLEAARKRIALDELLAYNLLQRRRQIQHQTFTTLALSRHNGKHEALLRSLGFVLTNAQQRVLREILKDLDSTRPMLRLLQGDVGSGKTVIAALAAIRAMENDVQTAFMAPTELLAEQHYETLSSWLEPLGISVGLLTGKMSAPDRRAQQEAIANGQNMVIVGTHALFQTSTKFKSLGLVVIDEQHRFGVHQRMQLRDKGRLPHQLVMTATPIPRTLAMYLFADMDVSIIDELPPGRKSIRTTVHNAKQRSRVIDAVRRLVSNGQQAYWVCVSIEGSDVGDFLGTENVLQELRGKLRHIRVGHINGPMKTSEKAEIMQDFRNNKIQVLVATTVIEVGIDVPNATLMVIDDADRLGVAQLHQLRGRVGRGRVASHCMLNYSPPISDKSRQRLNSLRRLQDGFKLAELDLSMRGPGEVFGTKQSGTENFKVASLETDVDLLTEVHRLGQELARDDPDLASEIINTWSPAESDYAAV